MYELSTDAGALWVRHFRGLAPPLVALHGFTQSGETFGELADVIGREVFAPDLPGHGRTRIDPPDMAAAVTACVALVQSIGRPVDLLGYSMGGRVAIQVAPAVAQHLRRLVLVSTSPGIANDMARAVRRTADEALADDIESSTLEAFIDRWLGQPLFAGLARRGPEWQARDRSRRLGHDRHMLAAALRGMGPGAHPDLADRLDELAVATSVVAGGEDTKYTREAHQMAAAIPEATVTIVPGIGHAVIGEAPGAIATLLEHFPRRRPGAR